jgi:hypothetical protein
MLRGGGCGPRDLVLAGYGAARTDSGSAIAEPSYPPPTGFAVPGDDTKPQGARVALLSNAREITVVVVSILIAFSLDAWWSAHTRRGLLVEQLQVVIEEMAATRDAIGASIRAHETSARMAREVVQQLEAADSTGMVTVPDTLIGGLLPQVTMDVSTAALTGFLESGGLVLVPGIDVRRSLRGWPTEIEDALDDAIYLRDFPAADLARYLRANFDVARAESVGRRWLLSRAGLAEAPTREEYGFVVLRDDLPLKNYLTARENHELSMVRTLIPLHLESSEVLAALARLR